MDEQQMQTTSAEQRPIEPAQPQVQQTTAPEAAPQKEESNGERYAIQVDSRTGRRSVVILGNGEEVPPTPAQEEKQTEEEEQNQQIQQPAQQQPVIQQTQEVKPYTAVEFVQAMQNNQVDESRIPIEQAVAYMQYKQQQSAQELAQQQATLEQQKPAKAADFYVKVEELARENALKELGLTEEELAVAEYADDSEVQAKSIAYQNALAFHRNMIMEQIQRSQIETQQEQQRQQAMYVDFNKRVNERKAKEPNFDAIIQYMYDPATQEGAFKQMGFDEGTRYMNAVQAYVGGNPSEQQLKDIEEYFDKARLAYYAKKNGLETQPRVAASVPKIERPGNSDIKDFNNKHVTKEQLSNARNYKERRALIGQILANKTNW